MIMKKIFISGSIGIKNLDSAVDKRIDNIINSDFEILIGDANGVDASVQKLLYDKNYTNVTVYCSGNNVRNNIGTWDVKKVITEHKANTKLFFTAKDILMAKKCDYGFMIWDSKSTGTLNNIYELVIQGKKSRVFVNRLKSFFKVTNTTEFEDLISIMNKNAFEQADKKIQLRKKLQSIRYRQDNLFPTEPVLKQPENAPVLSRIFAA
jgi:hypothetical protein